MKNLATIERKSDRELVITRSVEGPARVVYEAWSRPELFGLWWLPKSFGLTLRSIEMDVRVGGKYRLAISHGNAEPMAFFGTYVEVVPGSRLVWSNDDEPDGGSITTVTFEEKSGKTIVVMHELHPTKQALDDALSSGSKSCTDETFDQLDALLPT